MARQARWQINPTCLPVKMIARLKSLSKGDSFEFLHTKAYLPDGAKTVDVHGRKFIVV